MTTQANIQIGRSLLDGIEAHDLSRWEAALADNFTASYPSARPAMNMELNREQAKAYNASFIPAFPDLHFEDRYVLADGDKIVYFWDGTGTHDGPLALPTGTAPATHKKASVPGVLYVELKDGKIVREETYWNQVELLAQLGLMPA
jgi:steroid delta-isomerase-like uncharacterized protein